MHIAWPIVVGMLSYTAMGVSDTLLVGWVGKTELAAVGLGTTAVFLINSLFLGVLGGIRVVSSQATGARRHRAAQAAAWQGIVLALVFGVAVIGLSALDQHIFALMGGDARVQALAREYFNARVWAAPFWYVTIVLGNYYQGAGDTRTPMAINLVANGANIALDVVFIFGLGSVPAMGVAGAAWATVAASMIGMVMMLGRFLWQHRFRHRPRWRWSTAWRLLKVGTPMGINYVLGVGGFAVFTALLARMGEDQLAAHQIALKIVSMSFLPGHGIGQAAGVLTGQFVGARRPEEARRAFRSALGLAVGVMGVLGGVFWIMPDTLIRLFQDDPRVLEIGRQLLMVAAVFQIFDAIAMTAAGALNGTGDTRFTMLASVACSWLVMVPSAWFFGVWLELGALGAWMGLTAEIVVVSVANLLRFQGGAWAASITARPRRRLRVA